MQKAIKKETQWVILNSVLVELHPANLGILEIQTDDPIYAQIIKIIDRSTFTASEVQLEYIKSQLFEFKKVVQKGECLAFMLQQMQEETWEIFAKAALYFRANLLGQGKSDLNQIYTDLIRCFVLFLSSRVTHYLTKNSYEASISALKAVAMLCV